MEKNRLEEFVKANREEFDFRAPSPEVWDKIEAATNKPKVVSLRHYFMRAAAVAAIVIATGLVLWQASLNSPTRLAENADPELKELIEAEAFYSSQVNQKMKEIQKCYYTFPEIKNEIETDLNELEGMYQLLKNDLEENISNKSVIEAMIENNRYRLQLCDDVLDQIKC
ncbi:hypothetical protein SLH46_04025 [Draconibacterium sp. IB214405]|uniref:hypothetical protein n=1 Tax=Draconibacterium sp. IB214405 TaxID=3097352 RepID=UPI002A0BDDA6|nr:hypothetical protein [Draconibacterium sp. IB214405]MDX8338339.1 hypothetical protein [Draconibacterium sp. IB214405]